MRADDAFIRDRTGAVDLVDGTSITVRPIVGSDKDALQEGLQRLSPESRFLRFFSDVARLSDKDLRYLTEIDYRDHFAWVAFHEPEHEEPEGVGVGRYVRLAEEPEVAEAAIAVVDAWQRKGVGTVILSLLAQTAMEHGIVVFRIYVLDDNAELVNRMEREHITVRHTDGVYEVDVALPLEQPSAAARSVLEHIARLGAEAEADSMDR